MRVKSETLAVQKYCAEQRSSKKLYGYKFAKTQNTVIQILEKIVDTYLARDSTCGIQLLSLEGSG